MIYLECLEMFILVSGMLLFISLMVKKNALKYHIRLKVNQGWFNLYDGSSLMVLNSNYYCDSLKKSSSIESG